MADINKMFSDEHTKEIVERLTRKPEKKTGYISTLPKPHTLKTKIAPKREKKGKEEKGKE